MTAKIFLLALLVALTEGLQSLSTLSRTAKSGLRAIPKTNTNAVTRIPKRNFAGQSSGQSEAADVPLTWQHVGGLMLGTAWITFVTMQLKYQEDINRATGIYPYQIPIGYRPSEFEIFEPPDSKSTTDKQIADKKFAEAFRAAVATSDETTASS
jgi:hypothetical protein